MIPPPTYVPISLSQTEGNLDLFPMLLDAFDTLQIIPFVQVATREVPVWIIDHLIMKCSGAFACSDDDEIGSFVIIAAKVGTARLDSVLMMDVSP